jgi:hypothetical protein
VKGFDVYNALEACSQHLEQFGDMYAAGMTLKEELFHSKKPLKKSTGNNPSGCYFGNRY